MKQTQDQAIVLLVKFEGRKEANNVGHIMNKE